jgi:glycosyltransferase involved in cell wall biosynthesis
MLSMVALTGYRDKPTDGVVDYCNFLRQALAKRGVQLQVVALPVDEQSWWPALRHLWRQACGWRGCWVLLQYTALAWSRRGFPFLTLAALAILRMRGARCAIVFHEPGGLDGPRAIDHMRCRFQNWTVRTLHRFSSKSVFTVPLETIPWRRHASNNSAFIPLGANIPENLADRVIPGNSEAPKTVVVFCVSEPPYRQQEVEDISSATRAVAADAGIKLRVIFVGRGTLEANDEINRAFEGSQIEVCNRGLLEAEEITRLFSESHAMLAVRGKLYLRRASALAGIACGLPIIGYAGAAQGTIIEEAGVTLVPFGDRETLSKALRDILTKPTLWQEMHEKNVRVQQQYLSWDALATSYIEFFAESSA